MSMPPKSELDSSAAAPEIWRNRNYDDAAEAKPSRRRWLQTIAAVLSFLMLLGLLWNFLQPLVR